MKHKKQLLAITLHKKRLLSAVIGSICATMASQPAQAQYWTGAGADANINTLANWEGNLVPTTGKDAQLYFESNTVNAAGGSFTVNNNLADVPAYNSLYFNGNGFNLTGNQLALRPSDNYYGHLLINSQGGNNTISANLRLDTNTVNRVLSNQVLDAATVYVANGSLTLDGAVSADQINLTTSLYSPSANLFINNNVSAKSFSGKGGTQRLTGALATTAANFGSTDFTVDGTNGSINATDGNVQLTNSQLTLDNSTNVNSNRLSGSVILDAGSTLTLKGNAATDVVETASTLSVRGSNTALTNVKTLGVGANTSLEFSNLTASGLLNFASNGTLGDKESIKFNTAPILVDGLIGKGLVNAHEFAAYDSAKGVVAASTTNTLSGAAATDNVYISVAETLTGNTTVNSLAVNEAAIADNAAQTIILNSGRLLASGATSIAPKVDFGAKRGELTILGNTTLNGGLNANGLDVIGTGSLTLSGAGNVNGSFTHTGQIVLSTDNALQGADVTSFTGFDIGNTTQNVKSFNGGIIHDSWTEIAIGNGVTGSGSIVAANDINLQQNLVNVSLSGKNINIARGVNSYSVAPIVVNGNIQASQWVNLSEYDSIVNGVISGTANVTTSTLVNNPMSINYGRIRQATLTNQNTYTGFTSGAITLAGNGAIASSAGFDDSFSGSLSIIATDGDNGSLDRIGNTSFVKAGSVWLQGSGSVNLFEDIGLLDTYNLKLQNGNGTTTLRADALGAKELLVSLGDKSNFFVDTAVATYTGTDVVKNVYIEKTINNKLLPTWAAYDTGTGRISEALVAEKALNVAGTDEFVRVTDNTNQILTTNRTVAGVNVDTTQSLTGGGILTVASGQLLFWKDNSINISGLDFGSASGVVTNAGINTINSVISGSNGLVKKGEGTLVLTANNTYIGGTEVAGGILSVASSSRIGDVQIDSGAQLDLAGTAKITSNYGSVDLNKAYANATGSAIFGYGVINVKAGLTNQGRIYNIVSNISSTVDNTGYIDYVNNSGNLINNAGAEIYSLYQYGTSAFTNNGTVDYLTLQNGGKVVNNGTVSGRLNNSGTVVNNGTVSSLANSIGGTFTNNGNLELDGSVLYGTLINTATVTLKQGTEASGDGSYRQTAGTTTINGDLYDNVELEGGILKGTGRIFGDVTAKNGAIVAPGNSLGTLNIGGSSPGTLNIGGSLHLLSGSSLELQVYKDVSGKAIFDKLVVGGDYTFASGSSIKFDFGTSGFNGDNFIASSTGDAPKFVFNDFFKNKDGSSFDFSSLDNVAIAGLTTTAGVNLIHVTSTGKVSSVPVPAAVWLFGSGLLGLTGFARKRKAA